MQPLPVHFLPGIVWWAYAVQRGPVPLAGDEFYVRQGGHNRTWVLGPAAPQLLTVPTGRPHPGTPLAQVLLPPPATWAPAMGRTLRTAYGQAPFWEHYGSDVITTLHRPFTHLWHLNLALIAYLADALGVPLGPLQMQAARPQPLPMPGQLPHYYQLQAPFQPHLSVLDLLVHTGPEALGYVERFPLAD